MIHFRRGGRRGKWSTYFHSPSVPPNKYRAYVEPKITSRVGAKPKSPREGWQCSAIFAVRAILYFYQSFRILPKSYSCFNDFCHQVVIKPTIAIKYEIANAHCSIPIIINNACSCAMAANSFKNSSKTTALKTCKAKEIAKI